MTRSEDVLRAVRDRRYTYKQKVAVLAGLAENLLPEPAISSEAKAALDARIICDMYEGHAPYRARYILPDYAKALKNGSPFLELPPALDLDEAMAHLLIMYSNVPSITGYPVYFGDLDSLLLPYVDDIDDDALYRKLRLFWISLEGRGSRARSASPR